jgi:hypothetical protein
MFIRLRLIDASFVRLHHLPVTRHKSLSKNHGRLEKTGDVRPEPYRQVIAITARYACLGFIDSVGNWYSSITRQPIGSVIKWQYLERSGSSVSS